MRRTDRSSARGRGRRRATQGGGRAPRLLNERLSFCARTVACQWSYLNLGCCCLLSSSTTTTENRVLGAERVVSFHGQLSKCAVCGDDDTLYLMYLTSYFFFAGHYLGLFRFSLCETKGRTSSKERYK